MNERKPRCVSPRCVVDLPRIITANVLFWQQNVMDNWGLFEHCWCLVGAARGHDLDPNVQFSETMRCLSAWAEGRGDVEPWVRTRAQAMTGKRPPGSSTVVASVAGPPVCHPGAGDRSASPPVLRIPSSRPGTAGPSVVPSVATFREVEQ